MKFKPEFTILERIQLLQRWVLVQSFAYYELNANIATDFDYDANCNQLFELKKDHPYDWDQSQYRKFFRKFEPGCTSGFELISQLRRYDKPLFRKISHDAALAIKLKEQQGPAGMVLER